MRGHQDRIGPVPARDGYAIRVRLMPVIRRRGARSGGAPPMLRGTLQAGVSLLPVTVITLALSRRSGALAQRIGPRLQMSAGPVLIGAGLGLFTLIGASGNYVTEVLPGVTVFGLGLAVTVAPLTATVLRASGQNDRSGMC